MNFASKFQSVNFYNCFYFCNSSRKNVFVQQKKFSMESEFRVLHSDAHINI